MSAQLPDASGAPSPSVAGRRDDRREPGAAPQGGDLRAYVVVDRNAEFLVLSVPVLRPPPAAHLTGAELQVLALVMRGGSNEEIGRELGRATRTVANQIASIFRKVGVNSRGELVATLGSRS